MSEPERTICCFIQHHQLDTLVENIANDLGLKIHSRNSIEEIFEQCDRSHAWLIVDLTAIDPELREQHEQRLREEFSVPVVFLSIDPSETSHNHPIEIRIALPDEPTDFLHDILHGIHISPHCEKRSELMMNYGGLSKREKEVLRHVVEGENNKEIARLLYISERTVEAHRSHILQKMKMDSFVALACSHLNDLD
jgi:DNA-binding NarL/FixJ family response regulator